MKRAKEWVDEYSQSGAFDLIDSCAEAEEIVKKIQDDIFKHCAVKMVRLMKMEAE